LPLSETLYATPNATSRIGDIPKNAEARVGGTRASDWLLLDALTGTLRT
jgi:hypothetical protein